MHGLQLLFLVVALSAYAQFDAVKRLENTGLMEDHVVPHTDAQSVTRTAANKTEC